MPLHRTTRRIAAITLEALTARAAAARLVAALFHATALASEAPSSLVAASDAASIEVTRALRAGVERSLASLARELPFDAGLAVLFRLLFVLFAEARSLVPVWHQVYRDHYSLASLARGNGRWVRVSFPRAAGFRVTRWGCNVSQAGSWCFGAAASQAALDTLTRSGYFYDDHGDSNPATGTMHLRLNARDSEWDELVVE